MGQTLVGHTGSVGVTSIALGLAWPAPLHTSQLSAPWLDRVLDLADVTGPSHLPLRGP